MDTATLLESFGYAVIFVSVFIECGVLLGIILPLPGFTLLFTSGVLAAAGKMDPVIAIAVGSLAAISGFIVGYYTGSRYGRRLFYEKETRKYFTASQGKTVEKFMNRYGYISLIAGRFLPIVHNIIPLLSGIAKTPFVPFMIVNVAGAVLWVSLAVLLGIFAGQSLPHAEYYGIPILVGAILLANSPLGRRAFKKIARSAERL